MLTKLRRPKVIVVIIILVALIFSVYNIAWFHYIKTAFNPFLENEAVNVATDQTHERIDTGWTVHTYRQVGGYDYTHTVATPSYLQFGGNLAFLSPSYVEEVDGELVYVSNYLIRLMVFPSDWRYVLNIADLSGRKKVGSGINQIGMRVDCDGNPLPSPANDTESELYREWLVLYNQHREPVMELFRDIKEIYGEDAFG